MSAKGFYLAQEGHVVPLFLPGSTAGGKTSAAFSLACWAHASIILMLGATTGTQPGDITLNACSDATGANPVAIPFDIFACETSNTDVMGVRMPMTAAGYVPVPNSNIFYVIEFDASKMAVLGKSYLQLSLANAGGNALLASAVAILSAGRFAGESSATVLT